MMMMMEHALYMWVTRGEGGENKTHWRTCADSECVYLKKTTHDIVRFERNKREKIQDVEGRHGNVWENVTKTTMSTKGPLPLFFLFSNRFFSLSIFCTLASATPYNYFLFRSQRKREREKEKKKTDRENELFCSKQIKSMPALGFFFLYICMSLSLSLIREQNRERKT